jgi:hypothetical protein
MTWGTYGGRNPSQDGIRWHDVSEAVNRPISVPAGQARISADSTMRPQQDSNLRTRLRRLVKSKPLTCTDADNLAILGTSPLVGPLSWSLAVEQMRSGSARKAPQTCISPDDSGQFSGGDRP